MKFKRHFFAEAILILLVMDLLTSCATRKESTKSFNKQCLPRLVAWNEFTRGQILIKSSEASDSSSRELYGNGNTHVVRFFKNNRLTVTKVFDVNGEQLSQINYSDDSLLNLRWDMCKNNQVNYECIFYKGDAYGLSRKWGCDSSMQEEGFTFKNERFGIWHVRNDMGKITVINYKKYSLVDSLGVMTIVSN